MAEKRVRGRERGLGTPVWPPRRPASLDPPRPRRAPPSPSRRHSSRCTSSRRDRSPRCATPHRRVPRRKGWREWQAAAPCRGRRSWMDPSWVWTNRVRFRVRVRVNYTANLRQYEELTGLGADDEQGDCVRVLRVLLHCVHAGDERQLHKGGGALHLLEKGLTGRVVLDGQEIHRARG